MIITGKGPIAYRAGNLGGYKATCDMSINLCAPGTAYKATHSENLEFCRNILGEIVEMKGEGVSLTSIRPLTLHMGKNAFLVILRPH